MDNVPRMMSIRRVAATGLLPEHALRVMEKQGRLPALYIGKNASSIMMRLLHNLTDLATLNLI